MSNASRCTTPASWRSASRSPDGPWLPGRPPVGGAAAVLDRLTDGSFHAALEGFSKPDQPRLDRPGRLAATAVIQTGLQRELRQRDHAIEGRTQSKRTNARKVAYPWTTSM